jgi:signal transduction histidine kinase
MRRPLDRQLAVVEKELALARTSWQHTQQRLWIGAVVIVVTGLAGTVVLQQRMRKRGINKLKQRITRDLHDDVGSNLGSISFAAEQLRQVVANTEAEADLQDLSLLAREACASLREVVWVIDESTIHLPALIKKLVERAERVLDEVELSIEISEDFPDCMVSLVSRRHLVMFFKEVVHNCARHAQATRVGLVFCIVEQQLQIIVHDNGVGFDATESSEGWGLSSMRERAEEMGGEMELISEVGIGTKITLSVPLVSLSRGPRGAYITSN